MINNQSALHRQILNEITALDSAPVECDGFVRLAAKILNNHDQEYTVLQGEVRDAHGSRFSPHCYIEWQDLIIDFRAHYWLGPDAQHGFLEKKHYGHLYTGQTFEVIQISDAVEAVMLYQPSEEEIRQLLAKCVATSFKEPVGKDK